MLKIFRGRIASLFLSALLLVSFTLFKTNADSQNSQQVLSDVTQYIDLVNHPNLSPVQNYQEFHLAGDLTEDFESGIKASYTTSNVILNTGTWSFNNALIGDMGTDRKVGLKSARIRNNGKLTMLFDRTTGAGTVSIQHAVFGSDTGASWELWYSTDGGTSWARTGSAVTTTSTTLSTASFVINTASSIRFEIRKTSNFSDSNRLNFDSLTITNFGPPPPVTGVHTTMGNPSNAVTTTATPNNYLMEKPQYSLSYNNDKREPNWVSWNLVKSDLGPVKRSDDFREDTDLPTGWYRVDGSYFDTGYTRGHMCPSADRTDVTSNNSATFLMTNMIPQAKDNNNGPWNELEMYTRSQVLAGNEVYVISGGYGDKGKLMANGMTIPTRTWKVILVLPEGTGDVARVNAATRVIGVDMPNDNGIFTAKWANYRVSVDSIEAATGYDLFSILPVATQNVIESKIDAVPIP